MKSDWASAASDIIAVVDSEWPYLSCLPDDLALIAPGENRWSIKEILGHLIDSASNNHQRMVRLQYTKQLDFPEYGSMNDQWVSIQAYQAEDWHSLLALWKYFNLHIAHLIRHVDMNSLSNSWTDGDGSGITLMDMITGYVSHLKMHIQDIHSIANKKLADKNSD